MALPVSDDDRAVRLSSARARADGSTPVIITDLSLGGISLLTDVFLPRGCILDIRLDAGDGRAASPSPIHLAAQVRNVAMIDRAPRYKLGLRLLGDEAERRPHVDALLGLAARSAPAGGSDARA